MIEKTLILALAPRMAVATADGWTDVLNAVLAEGEINNRARLAAFLAQAAHESGGFYYSEELWGPTPAQRRYEGRADLGNLQPGDGYRYRGRGIFQLTGRHNYQKAGAALGLDLEGHPELAARMDISARIAVWYWRTHGHKQNGVWMTLNELADTGQFERITRSINGGVNNLMERYEKLDAALKALALQPAAPVQRVFLKDKAGKNSLWDGKPAEYGGVMLERYPDGALQLTRATPKPTDPQATPGGKNP